VTRDVGVAVCCVLVAVLASAGVVCGACPGDGPEVVLDCFSRAYSQQEVVLLEQVLAADYIWIAVAPPQVDVFRREDSVASSVAMFGNPQIDSVALEFQDGYEVVAGDEPGTWRIENLLATLTVEPAAADGPSEATLCATLYVRQVEGSSPGYEVYREVFFEGDGCVGK